MQLLLTGFEPFGGSTCNPSEQVARALDGQTIGGVTIHTSILPVDCERGPRALLDLLSSRKPDAVLCLGEAARRPVISVERVAVNLLDFRIPDNSGAQVVDQPVIPGGPAAYFVTIPARKVYEAIQTAGVPCELSLSAGAYLCNQVLYHLLHHIAHNGWNIPAGFIHVPSLPQQVIKHTPQAPSMSLDTSLTAIRTAIAATAETISATAETPTQPRRQS